MRCQWHCAVYCWQTRIMSIHFIAAGTTSRS
jgi:hypothetical protein